jgi:hypothetical protein
MPGAVQARSHTAGYAIPWGLVLLKGEQVNSGKIEMIIKTI